MMKIIDDLAITKQQLPRSIADIQPTQIVSLVKHWRSEGKTEKTILNRLSVIRSINKILMLQMNIPDNESLNIKQISCVKRATGQLDAESLFKKTAHSITRNVIALQMHFGLTQSEAIHLDPNLVSHNHTLIIMKNISHNNKERCIPILNDEQKNIIEERLSLCDDSLIKIMPIHMINQLIRAELKYLKIKSPPDFRSLYIAKRFMDMQDDEKQAIKTLMRETGITKSKRIYELLAPQ